VIPSALSGQLQQGLADFLRFSFRSSTPGMERVIDDLLDERGGLLKGPYVSVKLPFVRSTSPYPFPNVPLGFTPYVHQQRAFDRLGGRRKLSTLVATGTGSGKTECFLIPIMEHCLAEASTKGVKAIVVYPRNALASDQALRIARMVHGNDELRGKIRAGLFIGQDAGKRTKGETKMGPATIITDREVMRADPPDILLTNYKMLDYLLLQLSPFTDQAHADGCVGTVSQARRLRHRHVGADLVS
jgi:DEAD/DEAH box helicase domain-containing protein